MELVNYYFNINFKEKSGNVLHKQSQHPQYTVSLTRNDIALFNLLGERTERKC